MRVFLQFLAMIDLPLLWEKLDIFKSLSLSGSVKRVWSVLLSTQTPRHVALSALTDMDQLELILVEEGSLPFSITFSKRNTK